MSSSRCLLRWGSLHASRIKAAHSSSCLCRRNGTRIHAQSIVSVVSQNLCFDGDFLQATKCAFLQPQQKSGGWQLSSKVPSNVATFRATIEPTKPHTALLHGLCWPNIGPAAAGPAGPVPTDGFQVWPVFDSSVLKLTNLPCPHALLYDHQISNSGDKIRFVLHGSSLAWQ